MTLLAYLIGAIVCAEIILAAAILWLRNGCPWLITARDFTPKLDPRGLQSFLQHGWDSELGWIRKPNTSGTETGRNDVATAYNIDASGARLNPGFEGKPPTVLAYGDSYTFARQVDDDQTWAHYLSRELGVNVANYGVGNYGFDQALLRLEREYERHPAPVVVIGVVPETISRIHAYWKHYSEYGNTFAFKPRFKLQGGNLVMLQNPIDSTDKFSRMESYLPSLAADDFFYETKFKRDILRFPYCLSVFKNPRRTFPLMLAALSDRLGLTSDAAFLRVMRRNIGLSRDLYNDTGGCALFHAIVQRFVDFCRDHHAEPVLLMMPQRMDIERIQAGDHYYRPFVETLSKTLHVVDAAETLMHGPDMDSLFINDRYGGHLSAEGNKRIAHLLAPLFQELLAERSGALSDNSS